MRAYLIFGLVLLTASPAWSAGKVEYCTSLLKAKEVETICGKKNVTINPTKYLETYACALTYAADESDLKLMEPSTIPTLAQAVSSFEILKTGDDISGIGDRSSFNSSTSVFGMSHTIHIQADKHYLELQSNNFCSADGLKKLAKIVVSRLPK